MVEALLILAVVLFALGAAFAWRVTPLTVHSVLLFAGLAAFAGAFLYPLVNNSSR